MFLHVYMVKMQYKICSHHLRHIGMKARLPKDSYTKNYMLSYACIAKTQHKIFSHHLRHIGMKARLPKRLVHQKTICSPMPIWPKTQHIFFF